MSKAVSTDKTATEAPMTPEQLKAIRATIPEALRPTYITVPAGGLVFTDPEGRPVAKLGVGPCGGGCLYLFDGDGRPVASLGAHGARGETALTVWDERTGGLAALGTHEGEGRAVISDAEGRRVFAVPAWRFTGGDTGGAEAAGGDTTTEIDHGA